MSEVDNAVRAAAADEASTATALNDRAAELEKQDNHRQAAVYRNSATSAEGRASTWRSLLK